MKIIKKIKDKGLIYTMLFILCTIGYWIIRILLTPILKILPVKHNLIIFSSDPDYSDNSKALYNYYLKKCNNSDYKYVWLVKNPKLYKNENNTVFVKSDSKYHKYQTIKSLFYLSRCDILYFTHSAHFEYLKKKNGQLIINLWHGCGYKSVQKQAKRYIDVHPFDYALVPGNIFIKTKTDFWGCKSEQILPIGYPRYDLLFEENKNSLNYINKVKNKNKKIIVWLPTFRKTGNGYYPEEKIDKNFDLPLLESKEDLDELNEICKKNKIILCIKRHPRQLKYSCENLDLSNIIFIDNDTLVDNKVDLYSILKYTDGLITDYSSIAIDYILVDKPIAFTLDDFDDYSKTRGFVFDNPKKYMPGYYIYNFDDMKKYINDVGKDKDLHIEDRKKIMNEIHNPCDNYCERIIKKVNEIMEESNEKNMEKI